MKNNILQFKINRRAVVCVTILSVNAYSAFASDVITDQQAKTNVEIINVVGQKLTERNEENSSGAFGNHSEHDLRFETMMTKVVELAFKPLVISYQLHKEKF